MIADDVDPGAESEDSGSTDVESAIWWLARVALALVAVLVGIVWTVRIAIDGSLASGVLLRLLPPMALIYLGVRYFRSVVGSDDGGPS